MLYLLQCALCCKKQKDHAAECIHPSLAVALTFCLHFTCNPHVTHMLAHMSQHTCTAGGGRKVITVEVSLDGGITWMISRIIRGEEPSEHGKHWCWVFWQVQVPLMDLFAAEELRCRAVDSSNNMQPEK